MWSGLLAASGARWSPPFMREERNLLINRPDLTRVQVDRTFWISADRAIPDGLVEGEAALVAADIARSGRSARPGCGDSLRCERGL